MSVNDPRRSGAPNPLFFLDYFACGKLDPEAAAAIVAGHRRKAAGSPAAR